MRPVVEHIEVDQVTAVEAVELAVSVVPSVVIAESVMVSVAAWEHSVYEQEGGEERREVRTYVLEPRHINYPRPIHHPHPPRAAHLHPFSPAPFIHYLHHTSQLHTRALKTRDRWR